MLRQNHVVHVGAVGIVRAHHDVRGVDYVAILPYDIVVFVRAGFRADFQRAAPNRTIRCNRLQ